MSSDWQGRGESMRIIALMDFCSTFVLLLWNIMWAIQKIVFFWTEFELLWSRFITDKSINQAHILCGFAVFHYLPERKAAVGLVLTQKTFSD